MSFFFLSFFLSFFPSVFYFLLFFLSFFLAFLSFFLFIKGGKTGWLPVAWRSPAHTVREQCQTWLTCIRLDSWWSIGPLQQPPPLPPPPPPPQRTRLSAAFLTSNAAETFVTVRLSKWWAASYNYDIRLDKQPVIVWSEWCDNKSLLVRFGVRFCTSASSFTYTDTRI